MKIEISKLRLENFKCFEGTNIEFGNRTEISGKNGSGKTTIADGISWILFNKLSDSRTPEKIRPHDKSGKDIDYVDIVGELTMIVDGNEFIVKKTQSQIWTTPRGKAEAEYGGNKNSFEVNGVPMTEKNYKAKIEEIVPEEIFRFASNGNAFMQLDTKKRRAKLLELAGDITYADIVAAQPELLPIEGILARYSYEEAISMTNKELKEYKKNLNDIPVRIDELTKSKADGDLEMLQIKAENLRNQITGLSIDQTKAKIAELEAQKSILIAEADKEFRTKKNTLNESYYKAQDVFSEAKRRIDNAKYSLETMKKRKSGVEADIAKIRKEYIETQSKEWNGKDICPTCGQKLPQSSIDEAVKRFESNKKTKLSEITRQGNAYQDMIDKLTNDIAAAESNIEALQPAFCEAEQSVKNAQKIATDFTQEPVDTSEIDAQIENLKANENPDNDIAELKSTLTETERQIARIEANADIDKRIADLDSQRREISQSIANCEKTKYLLEEYSRCRVSALTEEVNKHFKIVKWVLFENQINGGISEVCNATVEGSILGSGLNTGHCVLAGFDICRTMQEVYGVNVPIIVDGVESLSEGTLGQLETDSQLILLKVDNNTFTVN